MKTYEPHRVFLSFDYVTKRAPSIGYIYVRSKWIARGVGVVMYQSKICGALTGDKARAEASKLAHAWLAKQNERPRMSQNVLASMEWTGPRYVDTTTLQRVAPDAPAAVAQPAPVHTTTLTCGNCGGSLTIKDPYYGAVCTVCEVLAATPVEIAIARFPKTFGLLTFLNGAFRISPTASYVNDEGVVMLYTQRRLADGTWLDFAKSTEAELLRVILPIEQAPAVFKCSGQFNGKPCPGGAYHRNGMCALAGVDELRSAVRWADNQPESMHEWKSAEQIVDAYRAACESEAL